MPLEVCVTPSMRNKRCRLPRWAAAHPIFAERMAEAIPLNSQAAASSFQALEDTVRTMKGVVPEIRFSSVPPGASLFAWQAHWLAAARQARARYDDTEVRKCAGRVGTCSELLVAPTGEVHPEVDDDAICEAIRRLRQLQVSVDMSADVQQARTEEDKHRASARHARRLAAYSPRNKVIQNLVVLDSDGEHIMDSAAAARALAALWAPTFVPGTAPSPIAVENISAAFSSLGRPGAHGASQLCRLFEGRGACPGVIAKP